MKTILTEVEGSGIQVQGKATFSLLIKGLTLQDMMQ